jgi:hypothetical protein
MLESLSCPTGKHSHLLIASCLLLCLCTAVYDVTRRETLESLSGSWMAELESYQPHPHVARMVVANKVDAVRRCCCCCCCLLYKWAVPCLLLCGCWG